MIFFYLTLFLKDGHGDTKELHIHRVNKPSNSPNAGSPAKFSGGQAVGNETGLEEMDGKAALGTPHKKFTCK